MTVGRDNLGVAHRIDSTALRPHKTKQRAVCGRTVTLCPDTVQLACGECLATTLLTDGAYSVNGGDDE